MAIKPYNYDGGSPTSPESNPTPKKGRIAPFNYASAAPEQVNIPRPAASTPRLDLTKTVPTPEMRTDLVKPSLLSRGLGLAKKGIDAVADFSRGNPDKNYEMQEVLYGKNKITVKDPSGTHITTPKLDLYKAADPAQKEKMRTEQDLETPILKFLNSPTGRKVTETVYKSTSNIPLKAIARMQSIGDKTYDEAYSALLDKRNDPTNNSFERILYGVQDSGVQSAFGALLAVGSSYLTRNPNVGRAVSTAYFAPIAAESQRQDNPEGNVTSPGNIAIDTVGDTIISGFAENALKNIVKEGGKMSLKQFGKNVAGGFLVEGTTEPTQTFLKYANDYKNATAPEIRDAVVQKVVEYVKSGAILEEFLIAGIAGGTITGIASGGGAVLGKEGPSLIPPKSLGGADDPIGGGTPPDETVPGATEAPVVPDTIEVAPTPQSGTPTLQATLQAAEERFGTNSPEYRDILEQIREATTRGVQVAETPPVPVVAPIKPDTGIPTPAPRPEAITEIPIENKGPGRTLRIRPEVTQGIEKKPVLGIGNTTEVPLEIAGQRVARPEQAVTKTDLRLMLSAMPGKSVELVVVTRDGKKFMTFNDGKTTMSLRPSALGLVEENIKEGDKISISAEDLKQKGTALRAHGEDGTVEASLATDLSDKEFPARTPDEMIHRIEQLNKFGQSHAILRRTGGLPKKAAGMFRHNNGKPHPKVPVKGIVHLQDQVVKNPRAYMSTLAHELGHALEYTLTGSTNKDTFRVFGRDLDAETKATIRAELKAITNDMVGEENAKAGAGYYYKNTELLARFLERMFEKPGTMAEIAPTAMKHIELSALETPIIAEYLESVYGTIDKGQLKFHGFFSDMKETYQKLLGKRVGTMAWNDEMRYRSMKARAQILMEKLIKDKFKNVKDDPAHLFQAAESIKVTKGGEPEYGTRDFKSARTDTEVAQLLAAGYQIVKDEDGRSAFELVDGKPEIRLAKTRYTAAQARALFDTLSPEGKQLIKDFTAARDEAKDYFNREVIKDVHKITSNLEGWVHHYWEDAGANKGVGGNRLKDKIASAKKFRTGAEGYVEDLQLAMTKALTELETTKAYNAFVEDYFARVSKPIGEGEQPDAGWVEVVGDVRRGGIGRPGEMRSSIMEKGKLVPMKKTRYQMPAIVYDRFKMIKELAVEASAATRAVNSINRYWQVNILFQLGSASTNAISGGLQYGSKVLTDFYTEALTGSIKFEKTRRDIYSMITTLGPKGWSDSPDWAYGGDVSNFYGQFGQTKTPGIRALDTTTDAYADKVLKVYGVVERYWKKVIASSEGVSSLAALNSVGPEGLRLPNEEEKQMLDEINSEIDLFAYDYENIPLALEKFRRNPVGAAVKPFTIYPYKYMKQITGMLESAFDRTLPWQERAAKVLAITTMIALYAAIRERRRKEQTTPEVPESAPPSVSTRGRLFVGTDEEGREKFTRVAKYPFLNITEAGSLLIEGHYAQALQITQDMIGTIGPLGGTAALIMGYRNEYQQFAPAGTIFGDLAASYVPGTRILADIARFFDPYQRKKATFSQSFTSLIPVTDAALQEKLRGEIKTIRVPLEGTIEGKPEEGTRRTTTDMFVKNYKEDVLWGALAGVYVNRIDPAVADAFVVRKAANDEKAAEKAARDEQ